MASQLSPILPQLYTCITLEMLFWWNLTPQRSLMKFLLLFVCMALFSSVVLVRLYPKNLFYYTRRNVDLQSTFKAETFPSHLGWRLQPAACPALACQCMVPTGSAWQPPDVGNRSKNVKVCVMFCNEEEQQGLPPCFSSTGTAPCAFWFCFG